VNWYCTASDVEERRQAVEALRDSEQRWQAVFEHNPTMYFIIDDAGSVLSVNPFGAEQLGYSVDELVGRSVLNVFHETDRATIQCCEVS
jgi:PAS domain S-box-containing protein